MHTLFLVFLLLNRVDFRDSRIWKRGAIKLYLHIVIHPSGCISFVPQFSQVARKERWRGGEGAEVTNK